MRRRKFVIGAGALFAGSTAAIGTGAVTSNESERGLTGRVASDKTGYIQITPNTGGAGHHSAFVDYNDGEITLDFGKTDNDGKGLNPDSVTSFRSVFNIENKNNAGNDQQVYRVWFESPSTRLSFFTNLGSLEGKSNAKYIDDDETNLELVGPQPYAKLPVGVEIDLRNTGLGPGDDLSSLFDADDQFVIHVERVLASSI